MDYTAENELSNIILGCAIEVHKQLGPGLLESAYQECLLYELLKAGLKVVKEKPMPIIYKDVKLDHGYRIDLLVNNKVVIEIKTVEQLEKEEIEKAINKYGSNTQEMKQVAKALNIGIATLYRKVKKYNIKTGE